MKKLVVAETFYSLQCEGRSIGVPAVFLRLGGCNLLCQSHSWICDTIDVWQNGKGTDFKDVLSAEFIARLNNGAHLVITGGEPLMQQYVLADYLQYLRENLNCFPITEVETNGTVVPSPLLMWLVDLWNVSPKLANSGMPFEKRYNEVALEQLNELPSIFKFVVANEADVLEMVNDFGILDFKKLMLMPAGGTQDELNTVRLFVAEKSIELGLRYSERLHIVIWNKKTGV